MLPMKRNTATTVRFPLFSDSTGALLTGASPTVLVSLDDAAFGAANNSPAEIATASGIYTLDLDAGETNADIVQIRVTATGAVPVWREYDTSLWIEASFLSPDLDVYTATIEVIDDDANTTDRYEVRWFKNGAPVESGITSPLIQVIDQSDGSDLIASTAMSQVGSTGAYTYEEGTDRIADGGQYEVRVTATIDGSPRKRSRIVGRDST